MGSFFYGVLIPNLVCELCKRNLYEFSPGKIEVLWKIALGKGFNLWHCVDWE